jgi:hypothetical protein
MSSFTSSLMPSLHLTAATLALALATQTPPTQVPPAPSPGQAPACKAPVFGVQVGDVVAHTFEKPIVNGLGARSLEDLRGMPVLIDFWGVRCANCIGAAVPASLKLQETFGDDLQVLLVECQAQSSETASAFALTQKWMGGRAMWTTERPFERGTSTLPVCVLLDNDGRVLVKGNPTVLHKEIERQIAAQVELRKSPPCGAAPVVRCGWSEFSKGRYARAFQSLALADVENAYDPASLSIIAEARDAFRARLEARIVRVRWLADNGWFDEADNELDALATGLKGSSEHAASIDELRAHLAKPELAAERSAARQLARMRARWFESGGDAGVARDLDRFADKHKGTPTGAQALDLLRLAGCPKSSR